MVRARAWTNRFGLGQGGLGAGGQLAGVAGGGQEDLAHDAGDEGGDRAGAERQVGRGRDDGGGHLVDALEHAQAAAQNGAIEVDVDVEAESWSASLRSPTLIEGSGPEQVDDRPAAAGTSGPRRARA